MFRGEEQKKLDVLSNEVFVKALVTSGRTCILVSVEDEDAIFVEPSLRGKYCVVFDPLDGSSNIDCGVSIGTIFGIYALYDGEEPKLDDVLQPGKNMVAAGYCMYGSSCTFVLTTGSGVHGFTLDQSLGEFILTHPDIKIPSKGKIYSVNEGNAKNWDGPTAKYVEKCKFPTDSSPPKSLRYIGSMVADVHRTLLYGGVFLYPGDKKSPNGKLLYANPNDTINFSYKHVLYEVFPMSFLMEQAGGQAFTGKERALDLVPKKIHERSPIFLGSYDDIESLLFIIVVDLFHNSFVGQGFVFKGDTVMDGDTGRSTGHEFVTSSSMQPLGRQELHGLQARMKFATDRTQSNFGSFYGFGLRSYGSGAGDKVLSTGKSSNNGSVAGVGSAMNSTVGGADKISAGQRNSFSSGATLNAAGAYEITYTRSGATTDTEAGIAPHTLRPLSPHLPIYKPQTNSTFSILDRISASYLTTLFVVYAVVFLKMGPICFTFEPFYKFLYYSVNLVPLSLELAALALAYHTYHGICHIWAIRGSRFLRFRK